MSVFNKKAKRILLENIGFVFCSVALLSFFTICTYSLYRLSLILLGREKFAIPLAAVFLFAFIPIPLGYLKCLYRICGGAKPVLTDLFYAYCGWGTFIRVQKRICELLIYSACICFAPAVLCAIAYRAESVFSYIFGGNMLILLCIAFEVLAILAAFSAALSVIKLLLITVAAEAYGHSVSFKAIVRTSRGKNRRLLSVMLSLLPAVFICVISKGFAVIILLPYLLTVLCLFIKKTIPKGFDYNERKRKILSYHGYHLHIKKTAHRQRVRNRVDGRDSAV